MSDDWQPDADWAEAVRGDLVPKLRDSAYVMSLVPRGETDVKFAVELGLSIMLDKPIIAVVEQGSRVPDHLVRVADRIIEADVSTDAGRRSLMPRLQQAMNELGAEADR